MPNATPSWVVDELLAGAVVRATLGAARYAEILPERGFVLSRGGVQKLLHRHGLGRCGQRVTALAQVTASDERCRHRSSARAPVRVLSLRRPTPVISSLVRSCR
jgi:hypothetical protein